MRLTKEQVEKVSRAIVERLKGKGLVSLKASEASVTEKVNEVILKDLRAEEALDKEVEEILKGHTGAIDTQKIDYRKMFNMIKGKLARERGIVI